MSKKLFKRKAQRKDYEKKVRINKTAPKSIKRAGLFAGDGILPKSRKYTPKKIIK